MIGILSVSLFLVNICLQLLLCATTQIITFHNKTCHQFPIIYTCTCISYISCVLLYYLYTNINVWYTTLLALQSHTTLCTFLLIYNNRCHIYFIYVLFKYKYYINNVSLLAHPGDPTWWSKSECYLRPYLFKDIIISTIATCITSVFHSLISMIIYYLFLCHIRPTHCTIVKISIALGNILYIMLSSLNSDTLILKLISVPVWHTFMFNVYRYIYTNMAVYLDVSHELIMLRKLYHMERVSCNKSECYIIVCLSISTNVSKNMIFLLHITQHIYLIDLNHG